MTSTDLIQFAAVLAAIGAAIVALVVSALDRKNAENIAATDRASALRQAHLMFELDVLRRLSENLIRGGSSDRQESARMGSEALALIGLLNPDRLPSLWEQRVGDDARLRAALEDPDMPEFKKNALETQLATSQVLREIREEISRGSVSR